MKEFLRVLPRMLLGIGAITLMVLASPPAAADNVPNNLRTYLVLAQTIKALDETGPLNSGLSDEIYEGFRTEDDPIGDQTLAFSQTGLAADLPNPGAARNYVFDLKKSSGHYRVTIMGYRMT